MKIIMKFYTKFTLLVIPLIMLFGCGGGDEGDPNDPMKNKGIGPVKSIQIGEIDQNMAADGEKIFMEKCTACHKMNEKYIGPALVGVTERRSPEWIMNMILNPEEMLQKDPIARELIGQYAAPMANQHLTQDEARKILEYFRTVTK